ncbi:MAG: MGMT family protein [Patescibacteria group bacterium]
MSPTQATNKFSRRPKRFSQNNSEGLTAFEYCVYEEVKKIPKGRVATYGQIARMSGKPRAMRAVGNVLNKNIFFDVPCHRVVRADGAVGGYAWGSEKKINVLRAEGVCIENSRVNLLLYGIT